MRIILATLLVSLTACYSAASEKMPYDQMRNYMLANGWNVVPPSNGDDCYQYEGEDLLCDEYPETKNCSGTGLGICQMAWERSGTTKILFTAGRPPNVVFDGYKK